MNKKTNSAKEFKNLKVIFLCHQFHYSIVYLLLFKVVCLFNIYLYNVHIILLKGGESLTSRPFRLCTGKYCHKHNTSSASAEATTRDWSSEIKTIIMECCNLTTGMKLTWAKCCSLFGHFCYLLLILMILYNSYHI